MRWQPFAVGAGLLLPPVVLAAAVWPDDASGPGRAGGEIEAELGPGDDDTATSNGVRSIDYLVNGPGTLTIDVDANGFDPTLTTVDPDTGRQLDYNDDRGDGSLNSQLVVDLDDDESVVAQVRSLNGPPGGRFTISVSGGDGGDDGEAEGEAAEPFTEPFDDEPMVLQVGDASVRLYLDEAGSSCMEVERGGSGSSDCARDIADLVRRGEFGGSSDGRTSTIDVVSMVGPEVAEVVAVLPDGSELRLATAPIPGRLEQVVADQIPIAGDIFEQNDTGVAIELRDADGDVLETWEA